MSIQESYKIIGGIAILFGTIMMITAGVTIGQYNNYCKDQNNEKSVEDKLITTGYACLATAGIIMFFGLIMFFGQRSKFISSIFTPKTILILGVLSSLTILITGLIQYSFIEKIKCEDEDSLKTVKNANMGCWVTSIILLVFMGIFYVSFEDEISSKTSTSEDSSKVEKSKDQKPKLTERQLQEKELDSLNKRLSKAYEVGEDPEEILELKAERAKLLKNIERRKASLKREIEDLEYDRSKDYSRSVPDFSRSREASYPTKGTFVTFPTKRDSGTIAVLPDKKEPVLSNKREELPDLRFRHK
jgi:hypothetical protein